MAERRGGGRKRGALGRASPALRKALTEYLARPDVNYIEIKRRTTLGRSTVQRIARGETPTTARLRELHALVGLPPPERSIETRLSDAFAAIAAADHAEAESIVATLEAKATALREAEAEESAAMAATERAGLARKRAQALKVPLRDVH
jgi:hypothetical protein